MAEVIANVQPSFDTFQAWIDKTNTLLNRYSTVVITTASNTAGGYTTGNAQINGIVAANVIAVSDAIKAGNVTAQTSYIPVVSNVFVTGNGSLITVGNSTVNASINSTAFTGRSNQANTLTTARNIAISTDATGNVNFDGSANVVIALTLASVGTAGTYGNSTSVPVITTDAKGRVTGVTNTAINFPTAAVTSVNGRTGAVVLTSADVTGNTTSGLGYTPVSANSSGSINGSLTLNTGDLSARDGLYSRDVRVGNATVNTVVNSVSVSVNGFVINSTSVATTGKAIVMAMIFGG